MARRRSESSGTATGLSSAMHTVDPLAGKISKGGQVLVCPVPLRLEAAHLAWRGRTALSRLAADDPAHHRIMPQPFGVVHILVSGKPTKYRARSTLLSWDLDSSVIQESPGRNYLPPPTNEAARRCTRRGYRIARSSGCRSDHRPAARPRYQNRCRSSLGSVGLPVL